MNLNQGTRDEDPPTKPTLWQKLRSLLRDRDLSDEEVVKLFRAWISTDEPMTQTDQDQIRMGFADAEVEGRLKSYKRAATSWRLAQVFLWAVIAGLGVAAAALGVNGSDGVAPVIVGSLIATLTGFTSAAHPGRLADEFENARLEIRDHAWSLLTKIGPYKDQADGTMTDDKRFEYFAAEVQKIVIRKRGATRFTVGET